LHQHQTLKRDEIFLKPDGYLNHIMLRTARKHLCVFLLNGPVHGR